MADIRNELLKRILILDGAMGTFIQSFGLSSEAYHQGRFADWKVALTGNNDVLNLTAPEVISEIHRRYIAAGADIIETNTFSANRISQREYQCEEEAAEMAFAGARLARQAADACKDRKIWVAGSMGPTSRTLSLAADINQPTERAVDFDEMVEAYREQAEALLRGGADLLLIETCFDALNAKAALYAIEKLREERRETRDESRETREESLEFRDESLETRGEEFEVMVSATINDRSGRTLTGQTLEAFYVSIAHYPILSFGLNCSFGVTELRPFIEQLAQTLPTFISIHPNAGLPNEMGEYDELPDFTASNLKEMAEAGLLNIAGGCCGTDDRHIRAIAEAMRGVKPHIPAEPDQRMCVAGLEVIRIGIEPSFTNIGERTNVAGSRKFARLIAEKKYEEAAQVARQQIEGGAKIIDINMDDAMLDSREEMRNFVRYISNEPAIATAVLMIDSSDWPTVLEGLKNAQGKCIVNSISLKGGEQEFLRKARELRRFGAAVVVMAFDEEGQATSYERKIAIAERAYRLLTGIGFPPQDIIFDVNILSVGTGIEEHAAYGIDFIRAVAWIKEHLPLAKTSGGVSNLSFAFRGNNAVREAMHSAFLYHAVRAGLDMGIVNPSMLQIYDDIEPNLLRAVEDVILNRTPEATETLIALADQLKLLKEEGTTTSNTRVADWRKGSIEERLQYALSKGDGSYLREDIMEALHAYGDNPVAVIEQPLMQAMEHVGRLFGEGKMFLPQVVKSAKVMREAVKVLEPELERENVGMREALAERSGERTQTKRNVVVLATANGDVHDIGKNIVGIVLACNNFEVHDLGVMVPNELILEKARELNPCFVGVSGLITPSLKEMENLCRLFQKNGMRVPISVGGATTSAVHTAVKLAPLYDGGVIYGGDASQTSVIAKKLQMNPKEMLQQVRAEQQRIRDAYENRTYELVSYEEANRRAPLLKYDDSYPKLDELKTHEDLQPTIADVEPLIDWRMFLLFWGFRGESLQQLLVNPEAEKTLKEGKKYLQELKNNGSIVIKSLLRFENVCRKGNDIVFADGNIMPMLRNQQAKGSNLSLADFFDEKEPRPIGLFCVTAGGRELRDERLELRDERLETRDESLELRDESLELRDESLELRDESGLMEHALRARLAEAATVWLQQKVFGGYKVIRPAFGYASCPDHSLKRILFDRIPAEKQLGVTLNDHYSITPSTTVCGLFVCHLEARYFTVGRIDDEQQADYAKRRNLKLGT
ncbi:MAG: homocysteine S-methyltransferase family protein [Prevotella sp.]|nr:homocysteine S-methyltransferase family protein [Prevotella sp.]